MNTQGASECAPVPQPASRLTLLLALVLAVIHLLSGFTILIVSSWFIAASSLAGLGFNYMLPAVVIRALAILRIASGYFSMLVGHSHLLSHLAAIRLRLFSGLAWPHSLSRRDALDALHHQSEEVAAIWMSWVGKNAGICLSVLLLNIICSVLLADLAWVVYLFTAFFVFIYVRLLFALLRSSAELMLLRRRLHLDIHHYIETAPVWHLYHDLWQHTPDLQRLNTLLFRQQRAIQNAALLLFMGGVAAIVSSMLIYGPEQVGDPLIVILPIALLSLNDWLRPSLASQLQLIDFLDARHSLANMTHQAESPPLIEQHVSAIELNGFRASNTRMVHVQGRFEGPATQLILGSSGTGKSRLLQAICGLLPFEGERIVSPGHLSVGMNALQSARDNAGLSTHQGRLADAFYVEQFPYVLSDTLAENLRIANRGATEAQLRSALEQLGLAHLDDLSQWLGAHGLPLSGGETKRLGLARALLNSAKVILLDEPFEALDAENIAAVVNMINTLSQRKLVFVATHLIPPNLDYQQCLRLRSPAESLSGQQPEGHVDSGAVVGALPHD